MSNLQSYKNFTTNDYKLADVDELKKLYQHLKAGDVKNSYKLYDYRSESKFFKLYIKLYRQAKYGFQANVSIAKSFIDVRSWISL